jgi:hypothetical protein
MWSIEVEIHYAFVGKNPFLATQVWISSSIIIHFSSTKYKIYLSSFTFVHNKC